MTDAGLHIESVTKRYARRGGTATAVDDVSVEIPAGQTLAVLGPSGCGKSSLLRIVAGIDTPDTGRVVLAGRELSRPGHAVDADRRDMNMVFQNYALWPHLRVRDIIGYGLAHGRHKTTKQRRDARVAELVELLRLGGLEDRRPAEISGGQQQRVAIARALATEPRLLLFDEPLSNLDVQLRAAMRAELAALLRRLGTTALYVTHDVTEALALADTVLVMDSGRKVQLDTPRGVFTRPANPWVAAMAGFSAVLEVTTMRGTPDGTTVAEVGGGRIQGRWCAEWASTGARAYVHPDAVTVHASPRPDLVEARVVTSTYEGRGFRTSVSIGGAGVITAMHPDALDEGAAVGVEIAPDGVLLFGERPLTADASFVDRRLVRHGS